MKRTIDWSVEYEAVSKASQRLAELVYENVMQSVPNDVWSQILCYLQKLTHFSCSVLTRVSQQLYQVTHQNLRKLNVKIFIWHVTMVGISQYTNITKLVLSGTASNDEVGQLNPMKNLKKIVIMTRMRRVDFTQMDAKDFPLFESLDVRCQLSEMRLSKSIYEKITELSVENAVNYDLDMFPNLTNLFCHQTTELISCITTLKRFGLEELTTYGILSLMKFKGTFIHKKIEYTMENGIVLKTKENGMIERIHCSDKSFPFGIGLR